MMVFDWLFHASLFAWTLRLYTVAAVGQTLFVVLWFLLPWWRTWVGRALMAKSFSLAIILDWALVNYHFGPFLHQQAIGLALFGLVALSIWLQLGAISREVWRGRQDRRAPSHIS
jgi:hypothetical protein